MTFQELQYYLEGYGCTFDPYGGDGYWVFNAISLDECVIEDLPEYSDSTLCHYFYELSVPAPQQLRDSLDKYRYFRENTLDLVPVDGEEEE